LEFVHQKPALATNFDAVAGSVADFGFGKEAVVVRVVCASYSLVSTTIDVYELCYESGAGYTYRSSPVPLISEV